jgi:hypothetical protein
MFDRDMNMNTLSNFDTTESRSFRDAVMDLRSRPMSTQTASSTFVRDGFETVFGGDLKAAFDDGEEAEAAFAMFDQHNHEHEEHEHIVQFRHDRIQVLQRCGDGLALTANLRQFLVVT